MTYLTVWDYNYIYIYTHIDILGFHLLEGHTFFSPASSICTNGFTNVFCLWRQHMDLAPDGYLLGMLNNHIPTKIVVLFGYKIHTI